MNHASGSPPAYGLWPLVAINSLVFILFAFSFFKPSTKRDWRTLGGFSAFVVALFVEMYGFPLTIYLLSGWILGRTPGTDLLAHDSGHLWYTLFGFKGNPHFSPIHLASEALIVAGFFLLAAAWPVLHRAQGSSGLASSGPYAYVRHPQYLAFLAIMVGFLLQWPTIPTVVMFPILLVVYVRLARREEREAAAHFGEAWAEYARRTPGWFPRIGHVRLAPDGPAVPVSQGSHLP
jgi:protein-S-isoprenylcysteine O-methyltransferase Ste14